MEKKSINIHLHIDVSGASLKRSPTVGYLPHSLRGFAAIDRGACGQLLRVCIFKTKWESTTDLWIYKSVVEDDKVSII